MREGPDTEWTVHRDGSFGYSGDDWYPTNRYTCERYLTPHQWFTLKYTIKSFARLEYHHEKFTTEVATRKVTSLKKAKEWADACIFDRLSHGSLAWVCRDGYKKGRVSHVYYLKDGTITPFVSLFETFSHGPCSELFSNGRHMGSVWPAGDYFTLKADGHCNHLSYDGNGTSSGGAQYNHLAIVAKLFRWNCYGLPIMPGPLQWGDTVVCKDNGLHGIVLGVPVAPSPEMCFYSVVFEEYPQLVLLQNLCTPEDWAARTLAR